MSELVTAKELAAILRRSTRTIYRMTHEGEIPFLQAGRGYLYDPEAVKERLTPGAVEVSWKQSRRSTSRKRVA